MNELPWMGQHQSAGSHDRDRLPLGLLKKTKTKTKCMISGSWKAGRAAGPAIPEIDQPGVPLYSVEDRRQELGQPHAQGETLTPPSVVCYCCAQNMVPYTAHPAFLSTVATFQERLGMATGGSSVPGRTRNSVLPLGSAARSMGWPVCPAPAGSHPFPTLPCL